MAAAVPKQLISAYSAGVYYGAGDAAEARSMIAGLSTGGTPYCRVPD